LPPGDAGTDLDHDTRQLVTRDVREGHVVVMSCPGVPVAAAQSGGHHANDDPSARHDRLRDVTYLRPDPSRLENHRAHRHILAKTRQTRRGLTPAPPPCHSESWGPPAPPPRHRRPARG